MSVQDAVRELRAAQGRELTPEERESVDHQLARLIDEQTGVLSRQWRQDNPGEEPQFEDLLKIQRWAAQSADEILTAQYREELLTLMGNDPEIDEPTQPDERPLLQQWVEAVEFVVGSDESLELALRLWSHKPPSWQVVAASLIEVWTIEGHSLPQRPDDEQARQVEALVGQRADAERALRNRSTIPS